MAKKVEVISKEMIKPSSPTPHHLKTHSLSFLDQIAPPVYIPLLFFYQTNQSDHAQESQLLKESLSHTLIQFYPLAGRIKANVSVDCNDAGAEYVEAKVNAHMSQIIQNPNVEDLNQILPIDPFGVDENGNNKEREVLSIQVNFFLCGGTAISVCVWHKVVDGTSLVAFIDAWASAARGGSPPIIERRSFGSFAAEFPPRGCMSESRPSVSMTREKNIRTGRFVFEKETLGALQALAACETEVKGTTRVEAVTAFIWRHVMEASGVDDRKIYAAVHAVNLRPRMSPPRGPETSAGNLWTFATAVTKLEEGRGYSDLAGQLRRAIRKIDRDYVRSLADGDGYFDRIRTARREVSTGEVEFCGFSSWCRFGVYEVDYGWGRPVWVSTTTMPFKNLVILMSTRCGDGIEAWITLLEEEMAKLENDQKFLSAFATDGLIT